MQIVSEALKSAYNEQYSADLAAWREIGGKYKAENIVAVCQGQKFNHVLECGAGEGSILKWLEAFEAFESLTALEISDSGIERIKQRRLKRLAEVKKFDGYEIPYADERFDLAICSHVLEHVEHPRLLLRELKRVSRFQVFEIPLDYRPGIDERAPYFFEYGHINVFTPSTFKFLLRSEGFSVLTAQLTHTAQEVLEFKVSRKPFSVITAWRIFAARTRNVRRSFRKILMGKKRFEEYCFNAYTCMCCAGTPVSILKK